MSLVFFKAADPQTPFAPNFSIPIYVADNIDKRLVGFAMQYIREIERDFIKKEKLLSEVPKSYLDPLEYTQHWKQHNLIDDTPMDSDPADFKRFPRNQTTERLFQSIRLHYLQYLELLGYQRRKVYIHSWANVLRKGEYISTHTHGQDCHAYLAGTVYVTDSNANFIIEKESNQIKIGTKTGRIAFWPSCLSHHTETHEKDHERITISFDIVVPETKELQPHRPYRLLDDPDTMPGLYE